MMNEQVNNRGERKLVTLFKLLGNSVACKILLSLFHGPKSVSEICLENKIPASSTYKAIKDLQQVGLISIQDIIIDDYGKRITKYETTLKSLTINLDKHGPQIKYDGKVED
jgi:predicted DNA-binding ArsR family transcriptional regulator